MGVNISGSYANPRLDLGVAVWEYSKNAPFIAQKALPRFAVTRKAASFSALNREGLLERGGNIKRASGAAYSRGDLTAADMSYECIERGHEQKLPDDQRALYANDFDAEAASARNAMFRVLLDQEIDVANAIMNTTTWTGSDLYTDGAVWATVSNDIIGDVFAAKDKVFSNTGLEANTLIVSRDTYSDIRKNTDIRNAIQYTTIPTEAMIDSAVAGILGVEKILVGAGVYNGGGEGGTFSATNIWSNSYAMVCVTANDGDGLETPCLGRTFSWVADAPDSGGVVVEEYREEQTRSAVYRARNHMDELIYDPYFGHLIKVD